MAQTPAITITGASGRMGQMLLQTVLNSDKARLVGAVERKGHPWRVAMLVRLWAAKLWAWLSPMSRLRLLRALKP